MLDEFIAWLHTKPKGEVYDYKSIYNCALAQFGRHKFGENLHSAAAWSVVLTSGEVREIFDMNHSLSSILANNTTFGGIISDLESSYDL